MANLVQIWSLKNLKLLKELPFTIKGQYTAAFTQNENYFALGSADKKIRIWELKKLLK